MIANNTHDNKKFYPVKGYEGIYWITKDGEIINKDKMKMGSIRKDGYIQVTLSKDKKCRCFGVHRIVAETFIDNPENKNEVNHKDGIKSNNNIDNLEWVTRTENVQHSLKTGLRKVGVKYNVSWRKNKSNEN